MRRYNETNDNRYYPYLPGTGSTPSQHSSINSPNRNTYYQYYDPRLRNHQQAQQTAYRYGYGNSASVQSPYSLYGSPRRQIQYQSPVFSQELFPSSIDTIADLGEPISVFDDIRPLEHRRSSIAPSISSSYVPPNPNRRPSASEVSLASSHVLRNQLISDIERSITDIDRELTALERRSSGSRYIPPRFSPIAEFDTLPIIEPLRQIPARNIKPISGSLRGSIPIVASPTFSQIQRSSGRSTITKEKSSTSSQMWPNKPKRVYQVIPSLPNDSRKTSRQSSVGAQYEQIKISEIQTPESTSKLSEKKMSASDLQYHYGPEAEENEIFSNDPEIYGHKSALSELGETGAGEKLNTDQFIRETSAAPNNRALFFAPQYGGNSRLEINESAGDLEQNYEIDSNNARTIMNTPTNNLNSPNELIIQDTEALIQMQPNVGIEPGTKPRRVSRTTDISQKLYHKTEADLTFESNVNQIPTKEYSRPSTKASTITPVPIDNPEQEYPFVRPTSVHVNEEPMARQIPLQDEIRDFDDNIREKTPSPLDNVDNYLEHEYPLQIHRNESIDKLSQDLLSDSRSQSVNNNKNDNNIDVHNVNDTTGHFFSDYGNVGENEEEFITIDPSNFAVPPDADVIGEDDLNGSIMNPSQPSLRMLPSAHVLQQQQQQQQQQKQITSPIPLTMQNTAERIKSREKEEIISGEIDVTNERIATPILNLPSPSPSPSPVHMLPTSINDDKQMHFDENNNSSRDDYYRQPSSRKSSALVAHPYSKHSSRMDSRIQSSTSGKNDPDIIDTRAYTPRIGSSNSHMFRNIDNEPSPTPPRIDSADQRIKSLSRPLSRHSSITSLRNKNDEEILSRIHSSNKTPVNDVEREYSNVRRPLSRQASDTPKNSSDINRKRSASLIPSPFNNRTGQSINITSYGPTRLTYDDVDTPRTPVNENEPHAFSVESEHFLYNGPQTPFDLNKRLPSGYSIPSPNESRRSSVASSILPIILDSPDLDNEPSSSSRPATPQKKHSVPSIDLPPDPSVLLTSTDEPDPDDPTKINSTIHFRMMTSTHINDDIYVPEREQPSPLLDIAPLKAPSRVQSVEIPHELLVSEDNFHDASSPFRRSPSCEIVLPSNTQLPPATPSNDIRLSSVSPGKHREEKVSSQNRLLYYPARLEDLMQATPSPTLSARDDRLKQKQDENHVENNRLPSISPKLNEVKSYDEHHPLSPSKSDYNSMNSPPHSRLSNTHHLMTKEQDTNHQRTYSSSISPQDEKPLSPYHNYSRPSSQKSTLSVNHEDETQNRDLSRNDAQLSSASIKFPKQQSFNLVSQSTKPQSNEENFPSITQSQINSKLSLRVRQPELKHEQPHADQSSPQTTQFDTQYTTEMNNNEDTIERKPKQRQHRRVSFSSSIEHYDTVEPNLLTNWRERVAAILANKHRPNEKYAHIQSRVNSFANFEYQPKKLKTMPLKQATPKTVESNNVDRSKFLKRKKFKVKRPKTKPEKDVEGEVEDVTHQQKPNKNRSDKGLAPQLFGRLWCLPDGRPTVFHEPLEWNVPSKLNGYSFENSDHEPLRNEFKIFNKKPKWHSESKLADLIRNSPRSLLKKKFAVTGSLPNILDGDEPYFSKQMQNFEDGGQESLFYNEQSESSRKIFDIQTAMQHESTRRFPQDFSENMSHRSYGSRPSDALIFSEKLVWTKKSKLKEQTWKNVKYQPRKSNVQIFHKKVHWNSEPKIRTHSPSTLHPSRASTSHVQIFDEKLNWDARAKVHCWSEIDLRQLTKKKAIFAQYHDPKWNDVVTSRIDTVNYKYPKFSNHVQIFSKQPIWSRSSELKDYVWENFDYKLHPRTEQSNDQQPKEKTDQVSEKMAFDLRFSTAFLSQYRRVNTPPNRPRWNTVSKPRSVNTAYNPKLINSTMIRRGWDKDLRHKRVHRLPPLKRKREHNDPSQLAIEAPPSTLASTTQLAIEYNNDHSSTTHEHATIRDFITTSSRRSSKALVPLNHHQNFGELALPTDALRSQRPVQQEWYDEMTKSRLTHRTDNGRNTNHSFRHSIDSLHHPHTPRELVTFRSSTRNSQNSVMSGTLLDSSVRTNRTTEFRLSRDMDEHHHHSHTPSQSMPIEIRGFKLEGTQLTVPDNATIRPLSNVNYQASERVKSRRIYPWSSLHPHGTSSRNSSLVPIAEFRRPSLDSTITETRPLVYEE